MQKMLIVVFDNDVKTYEGARALNKLDLEGSIDLYDMSVIKKNTDGTVVTVYMDTVGDLPFHTLGGTAVGSLIGILGGPIGVIVGATAGTIMGAWQDVYNAGVSYDFIEELKKELIPGKYALVAEINEDWVTPLDVNMEKLGGQVFRTAKLDVEVEQRKADMAALNAEIAQLKKEVANARGEQKAKLQARIDKLIEKQQKKSEQAKQRLEQIQKEHKTKVQALKDKAVKAHGEIKAKIDARATQIRESHDKTVAKWKNLEAERLEKMADRLEKRAKKLKSETS